MKLEKLQLPDFVLAELYKDHLVVLSDETHTEQSFAPESSKWFFGENKKNVTILVNDSGAVYLRDEWLNFLSSILSACKMNLSDVAIINYFNHPVSYKEVQEKLSPAFFILFDVTAASIQLPFTIPHYQMQKYNNCIFLLAPSLQNMLSESKEAKLEKSKLWLSLKKMFSV